MHGLFGPSAVTRAMKERQALCKTPKSSGEGAFHRCMASAGEVVRVLGPGGWEGWPHGKGNLLSPAEFNAPKWSEWSTMDILARFETNSEFTGPFLQHGLPHKKHNRKA